MEILAPGPFSYVDAGSASFIFQAAIGGALALSFTVKRIARRFWGKGDTDGR